MYEPYFNVLVSVLFEQGQMVNQCPLPVSLCFFHRLLQAVRLCWDEYADEYPGRAVPSVGQFLWKHFQF